MEDHREKLSEFAAAWVARLSPLQRLSIELDLRAGLAKIKRQTCRLSIKDIEAVAAAYGVTEDAIMEVVKRQQCLHDNLVVVGR